jgi:hypothetical protein
LNLFKRRIIAYIVGKLVRGKDIDKLFDQSNSSYIKIAGEVTLTKINVYDMERNELITGSGDTKGISLYDFATAKFIDLKINKEEFDGFDYETKKVFYGNVKDNTISVFDFQDSKHHYYTMLNQNENLDANFGLLI